MRLTHPTTWGASLLACAQGAWAHDGHGLTGSHWHASDTWGFIVVAALAAASIWLSRRDK